MPACDPEKFVNRVKELALVTNRVARLTSGDPFPPHERDYSFCRTVWDGKSCLLEKFYDVFDDDPYCVPILIQSGALRDRHDPLIDEFMTEVYKEFCSYQNIAVDKTLTISSESRKLNSSILVRFINLNIADKALVLLLDEINVLERKELQDIEENLLEELLHGNGRVVLITAGRTRPMLNDFALRPSSMNTILLSAFDENTTGEQLTLKPGSALVAGKVLNWEEFQNNTKLADHIVGDPPAFRMS
jgi:hypothetical protein